MKPLHETVVWIFARGAFLVFGAAAVGVPIYELFVRQPREPLSDVAITSAVLLIFLAFAWNMAGRASRVYLVRDSLHVVCWRRLGIPIADVAHVEETHWGGYPALSRRLVLRDGRQFVFYATDRADALLAEHGVRRG